MGQQVAKAKWTENGQKVDKVIKDLDIVIIIIESEYHTINYYTSTRRHNKRLNYNYLKVSSS